MENVAAYITIDGTVEEQSSMSLSESQIENTNMKIETKLEKFALETEANNQHCMEKSSNLEEKEENRNTGLFAPFSHDMKPDLEYIKLVSEQSTSNQEVATKIINDRYKWLMESVARRKMKDKKDKMTFTQLSHNLEIEDVKETTQLLHNLHITSDCLTKDHIKEFSDNHFEKINWHGELNEFIDMNDVETNTKADIPSVDMLDIVTEHYEGTVEDFIKLMWNEQQDAGKSMAFTQSSQKLDTIKCMKAAQASCNKVISCLYENDAGGCTQVHCGIVKGNDDFDDFLMDE